jgi:hypothetical protein
MYLTGGFLSILYTPFTLFYGKDIRSNIVWGSRIGGWTLSTEMKFPSLPVTKPRFYGRPYSVLDITPTEVSVKFSTYLKMLQMEVSSPKNITQLLLQQNALVFYY